MEGTTTTTITEMINHLRQLEGAELDQYVEEKIKEHFRSQTLPAPSSPISEAEIQGLTGGDANCGQEQPQQQPQQQVGQAAPKVSCISLLGFNVRASCNAQFFFNVPVAFIVPVSLIISVSHCLSMYQSVFTFKKPEALRK
jgi:hypothetical protein